MHRILIAALIFTLLPAVSAAASRSDRIEATYGVGNIENGTSSWTDGELKILEASLKILTKQELRGVNGVRMVRMRRSPRIFGTGLYKVDSKGSRILVYDRAFKGPGKGSTKTPNHTLVHEFGHAIAHKAVRVASRRAERELAHTNGLVEKYNAAVERYNNLTRAYNKTGDRRFKNELTPVKRRVERLSHDIVEGRKSVRKYARAARERHAEHGSPFPRWGVLHDYKIALGPKFGPTPYGRSSLEESFAESFMLHKVDRKTLKDRLPAVAIWLAGEGHLNPSR